ncbi:MAG TPA: P1 family peptidase [Acidimicrobiales bacterium]|nr:P1 family peptidase [Acidimicrobiales bacterium]
MITDVEGVRVGHWTAPDGTTGCTVVRLPEGTVASGELRGGAPATRDAVLLAPDKTVSRLDAVLLSGRSVFGMAAVDGVLEVLVEEGVGLDTPGGPVPIVVGLGLFDLTSGDPAVRPGPEGGAAATRSAADGPFEVGRVGVGAGATLGKWLGREHSQPGGLGTATVRGEGVTVAALVAVNAVGWIDDGTRAPVMPQRPVAVDEAVGSTEYGNTTIGVVVTDAELDKAGCHLVARAGHGGLSRAIVPVHTTVDGDGLVAAATGRVAAPVDLVGWMATLATERAIRAVSSV